MRGQPRDGEALDRAARLAGPGATVKDVQELRGGTHAHTYLVRTENPDSEVILREFPVGDAAATRESRALDALDGLGGMAPRLLATGVSDKASNGGSWTVISRLSGKADITPDEPSGAAERLGTALARIHATPLDAFRGFENVFAGSRGGQGSLSGPAAGVVAENWDGIVQSAPVLTHYDFWSGNVVWDGKRLTGVVDWSDLALGPPGFDVGWCRLDLYLLFDEGIADMFLASYRAGGGTPLRDPTLWDLWAVARSYEDVTSWVPNYRELGRGDLTAQVLQRRHAHWTEHLLQAWIP